MENASALEVAWFCIGLLALAVALWNLADALTDWRWVWDAGAGLAVRRAARAQLLRAAGWLIKALLLVWIGAAALLLPPSPVPPTTDPLAIVALRLSTVGALILVALLLTGMVALEAWERRTWRRMAAPPEAS